MRIVFFIIPYESVILERVRDRGESRGICAIAYYRLEKEEAFERCILR